MNNFDLGRRGIVSGSRLAKASVGGRMARAGAILLILLSAIAVAPAATPAFNAAGSVEQVYATGLAPNAKASLISPRGRIIATQNANPMGGLLFRNVRPGTGYRVRSGSTTSRPLVVHDQSPAPWDPGIYNQTIKPGGYGYLTTRDGTKLSYTIHPPTSPAGEPGLPNDGSTLPNGPDFLPPYPTLIEYSGYAYANPPAPESGIAVLANLMGFAVVDVTMRGAGCSGGAFDFFEPLQSLDGYDIIETIAHQPWVLGHRVGMIGISYGGISQLFTAQNNPPHLAAIAPLSVIDSIASVLFPGGNLNKGFAYQYAQERQQNAEPAGPHSGQPWAWQRIQAGDKVCAANQVMHGEAADLLAKIKENDHYVPAVADPLDPVTFVHKIKVPTFLACQWTDEQTGGFCPILASHFTGTSKKWFTFTNGVHTDSLDFYTYNRWYDFLNLYVAHRAPMVNAAIHHAAAPAIAQGIWGIPQSSIMSMPVDPIQAMPTYGLALRAFEKLPMIRILMDNGAGTQPLSTNDKGNPYPTYELNFDSWPIAGTAAQTWYFGPGGTMSDDLPDGRSVSRFTWNWKALPLTDYTGGTGGGGIWGNASQWKWNWKQNPAGTALSYVSAPLKNDATVIGAGAVYVWVRSSVPNVDLQATITEIRPDGNETFVQNGFMRTSIRKLSTDANNLFKQRSTLLNPIPSFTSEDVSMMPRGRFVRVAIPLYYEGHVYRAGSRLRVIIAAPNGQLPIWSFNQSVPVGTADIAISTSPSQPSFLVLPVIPGLDAGAPMPPCGALRNEPCRPYVKLVNQSTR